MNIAFPVLILTLALVPGFLFRYAWLRGSFRRSPVNAQQVAGDVAWLIIGSLIIHVFVGWLFHLRFLGPRADVLAGLFTGSFGKDSALVYLFAQDFSRRPWGYVGYVAATCALGYLVGLGLHALIRQRRWDLAYPALRFPNDWYYLLDRRANAQWFDRTLVPPDVYLSAVIAHRDAAYLYRGVVVDWTLSPSGDLAWVVLDETYRRPFAKDREPPEPHQAHAALDSRYHEVVGDHFILARAEMATINLQYIYAAFADELAPENASLSEQERG